MRESFDPYYRWLGIAPEEQPADHYRLLGLRRFESNADVIANAADRQVLHVSSFQSGQQAALCQTLLAEIDAALVCLLDAAKKAAYDQQLRKADGGTQPPGAMPTSFDVGMLAQSSKHGTRHKSGAEQLPAVPMSRPKDADAAAKATQRPQPRPVPAGETSTVEATRDPLRGGVDLAGAAALESQTRDSAALDNNAPGAMPTSFDVGMLAQSSKHGTGSAQPIEWLGTPRGRRTAIGAAVVVAVGLLGIGLLILLGTSGRDESPAEQLAAPTPPTDIPSDDLASGPLPVAQGELVISSPADGLRVAIKSDGRLVQTVTLNRGENRFTVPVGSIEIEPLDGSADFEISSEDSQLAPHGTVAFQLRRPAPYLLASAGADQTIKLWDPSTGDELRSLRGHTSYVISVAFSPDGSMLASASLDTTIKLWDPATGGKLRTLRGHTGWVESVAFSPDGSMLASASLDTTIKLWDPATGQELRTLTGGAHVKSVAFSPDGSILASASRDKTIKLWNPATGGELRTLRGHTGCVDSVAFSPVGSMLASASDDYTIKLWHPATGQTLRTLTGHTSLAKTVAFSPNGSILASGGLDGTIKLWDPATGKELRTSTGEAGYVVSVAFSPDGSILASASRDDTIKLWDPGTAGELRTLTGTNPDPVHSVAFSPLLSEPSLTAGSRPPDNGNNAPTDGPPVNKPDPGNVNSEMQKLAGTWQNVTRKMVSRGARRPSSDPARWELTIQGDQYLAKDNETGKTFAMTFTINPQANPKTIDMIYGSTTYRGIYLLDGDTLTIFRGMGSGRPKSFATNADSGLLLVWKREKRSRPDL